MSEYWTFKPAKRSSFFFNIISNKSKWFIAEDLLEIHAELICKLFNESQKYKKEQKTELNKILKERQETHGPFKEGAIVSQQLKNDMKTFQSMDLNSHNPVILEGIDNICQKLARIAVGNENEIDHWIDIAGYATRVANSLEKEELKCK